MNVFKESSSNGVVVSAFAIHPQARVQLLAAAFCFPVCPRPKWNEVERTGPKVGPALSDLSGVQWRTIFSTRKCLYFYFILWLREKRATFFLIVQEPLGTNVHFVGLPTFID